MATLKASSMAQRWQYMRKISLRLLRRLDRAVGQQPPRLLAPPAPAAPRPASRAWVCSSPSAVVRPAGRQRTASGVAATVAVTGCSLGRRLPAASAPPARRDRASGRSRGRQILHVTRAVPVGRGLHPAVAMLQPAQQVVPLLPDIAPARHVVEAGIENPGDVGPQWRQRRPHRGDRRPRLRALADEVRRRAAVESVVEQPRAWLLPTPMALRVRYPGTVPPPASRLTRCKPSMVVACGLRRSLPSRMTQMCASSRSRATPCACTVALQGLRGERRARRGLPAQHAPDAPLAMPTGGQPRGKRRRCGHRRRLSLATMPRTVASSSAAVRRSPVRASKGVR